MILDQLDNYPLYQDIHPLFNEAFLYLRSTNLGALAPGKHEINGNKLFALVSSGDIKVPGEIKMEAHRKYIDIQFILEGTDKIGYRQIAECTHPIGEFDVTNDYILFSDEPRQYFILDAQYFAVFFPSDAHAPLLNPGHLKKIVLKVQI